ncbi:MAG: O-antigen ligase family protein [Lentisphaeria bacterium]|nr:O-antigen ligase family protein [Lentisphaeria bacterium]
MKKHSLCDTIILAGIGLVLVFSPLAFGAVHVWAYAFVELVVFFLLALWCLDRWVISRQKPFQWVSTPLNGFALLIMALILIQTAPLPAFVVDLLSPKVFADKTQIRDLLAQGGDEANPGKWFALSYYLHSTQVQGLKLAAVFGVFFLVVNTVRSKGRINFLIYLLVFVGLFEALYGIAQYFRHSAKILWLGKWTGVGTGTFLGSNHYAFYMEMAFCLCVGVVLALRQRGRRMVSGFQTPRSRIQRWVAVFSPESTRPRQLFFLFVAIFLGVALLSSGSRGALIAAALGMLFVAFLYLKKGHARYAGLVFMLFAAALGSGLYLGTDYTLEKFNHPEGFYGRMRVTQSVVPMIEDYPAFGVGLGNFQFLYPRHVPGNKDGVASTGHAHNDWIEAIAELGLLGGGLIIGAFFLYLHRMFRIWRQRNDPHAVGIGAGVMAAAIATGFHSFFDFSLHYLANPLTLAAILALGWVAVHRRGAGYSESFFYGTRTFFLTRFQRIGLFAVVLAVIGLGMSLSLRHGLAEAYCPSEWNSTMNLDLKPDADKIQEAISYNGRNADYYFKQAMQKLDYRMKFQSVAPNESQRIIDSLTKAIGLNPARSIYWVVLAKRWVAKSYDGYGYVTQWLPLADQCYDMAVKCAPGDGKLLFQAAAHWLWRSAMFSADSVENAAVNNAISRQEAVSKFQKLFQRALAIDPEHWKKAAELVWMYYPEDTMIYALAPDDDSELKSDLLKWVAEK